MEYHRLCSYSLAAVMEKLAHLIRSLVLRMGWMVSLLFALFVMVAVRMGLSSRETKLPVCWGRMC